MKKLSLLLFSLMIFAGLANAQDKGPKFSGLMFGDYYYVTSNHDQTQNNLQAFEFRRIYLTADYTISNDMWARFRLESDPTASNLGNGKLSTMVKDAFLDWKNAIGNGDLVLGLQGTWNINMAEGIFGYRPLEKTIQDLHGISASRDLGISLTQKFSDEFSAGLLLGNNTGNGDSFLPGQATNVSQARYKSGYLFLQFVPATGFTILVNGQYSGAPKSQYAKTGDVIVNYTTKEFSLGVQGFVNAIDHGEANGSTLQRNGISLNGWVGLADNIRFVGRFDSYTPDANNTNTTIANSTQTLILGALDFAVRKNVHIMPNVEYTSYGLSGSKADMLLRATFFFSF
ncbi:MAG: hypothetical protein ACYCVH_05830 [Ignavibacteriaceae bacterium]